MKLRLLLFLFGPAFLLMPLAAHAQVPRPTCIIGASSGSVQVGQTVNLTWQSANATAGNITSIGSVKPAGTQGVIPTPPSTTFVGTFTGPGGSGVCSITITVSAATGGFTDGSTNGIPSTGQNPAVPPVTQSGGNGIVPCGNIGQPGGATGCQLCNLAQLGQNIINWLLGFSIPLAAAMFAYAGYLYAISGIGIDKKKNAHEIFKNVGVGFVIVLCAWLGVQTLLKTILKDGYYQSWNSIQCVDQSKRPVNKTVNDLLGTLPGLNTKVDTSGASNINGYQSGGGNYGTSQTGVDYTTTKSALDEACGTGDSSACNARDSFAETGKVSQQVQDVLSDYCGDNFQASCSAGGGGGGGGGGSSSNPQFNQQLANACAQTNISCDIPQRIAGRESSNGNDCTTSNTGAAGCMQVLATTACRVDSSISDECGNCLRSGNSINPQCAPVIQTIRDNPQVGVNLGVQYINNLQNMPALSSLRAQYGDCQITAAAYFQGPGNVLKYNGVPPNAVTYVNKACN